MFGYVKPFKPHMRICEYVNTRPIKLPTAVFARFWARITALPQE